MYRERHAGEVSSITISGGSDKSRPHSSVFGIGIDFGTSNSAAAVFDGERITLVQLEDSQSIMPSASYIDRDLQTYTGQEAIDLYIARNQGRKVELSAEVLGEARTGTGQIDPETNLPAEADTHLVYGRQFVDGSMPGRLFRGTKRLLGNAELQRIMVFDRPFRIVALITPILLRIRRSIESTLKELVRNRASGQGELEVTHACIGHPVNFEGREANHNQVALERLSEACRYAGINRQGFYPEPTAATLSYLEQHPEDDSNVVLTVDFGGGTLDLCVLRRNGAEFGVIAIHGVALGGDHIDQCLFRKLLFPLLGQGEDWTREVDGHLISTLFPFKDYEDMLLNWTISYMLNQNQYTTPVLDKIRQGGADAVKFKRLYDLITQNYAYLVFQEIKNCKAALSEQESVIMDIPEIDVEINLTRADFEEMIGELLEEFECSVEEVLSQADLDANQVDLVLRTGGSCLIPAVRAILDERFPGKVVEHDPFTGVAAGLAIADYYGYGRSL